MAKRFSPHVSYMGGGYGSLQTPTLERNTLSFKRRRRTKTEGKRKQRNMNNSNVCWLHLQRAPKCSVTARWGWKVKRAGFPYQSRFVCPEFQWCLKCHNITALLQMRSKALAGILHGFPGKRPRFYWNIFSGLSTNVTEHIEYTLNRDRKCCIQKLPFFLSMG